MTEGGFTESDAENDGLVKREAGQQLNSVLARESGELYTKFRKYCDELDLDPSIVLGDMVLRAIQDDNFAQEVASTVVDVEKLNSGDVKREDLEMVTDIIEQFGDDDDSGRDPIDKMVEERLSAVGQGPLGAMNEQRQERNAGKDQKIRELEREIEELKQGGGGQPNNNTSHTREEEQQTQSGGGKEIDDLFDGGDETVDGGDEPEQQKQDTDDLFGGDSSEGGDEEEEQEEIEFDNLGEGTGEPTGEETDDPMTADPEEPFSTDGAVEEEVDNE
mgnify:CR=1 FL=1